MVEALTPAPFDQRNLVEDAVLENIFDGGNYLPRPNDFNNHHIYVGFIENEPALCDIEFNTNVLYLRFAYTLAKSKVDAIKIRLTTDYDDGITTRLHYEYNNTTFKDMFSVVYYFKED